MNLALAVPNSKVLLLRATYGELQEEIIPRLEARIPKWVGSYSTKANAFLFYNGARLRLGYMARDDDKKQYIGAEYILIAWDELTLLPWSAYEFMRSRLRATGEINDALNALGLRPRMIASSNPGGPYHSQVREHFVDAAPPGKIKLDKTSGLTRVYVPATVDDNPHMPPSYRKMLMGLPEAKRKALLEGSWDVLEGVRFTQFSRNIHVISPEQLPLPLLSGERVIGCDYGFADPFAAVWGVKLADGLVLIYRELYQTELTATQQAEAIMANTTAEEQNAGFNVVLDPSMWRRDNATSKRTHTDAPPVGSPAHDYQRAMGRTPLKAHNQRIHGWGRLDEKLRQREDGWPRLVIYDTCIDLIRTLPTLLRSNLHPDDVAQSPKQEDHLADALRYLLMHVEPYDPVHRERRKKRGTGQAVTAGLMGRRF